MNKKHENTKKHTHTHMHQRRIQPAWVRWHMRFMRAPNAKRSMVVTAQCICRPISTGAWNRYFLCTWYTCQVRLAIDDHHAPSSHLSRNGPQPDSVPIPWNTAARHPHAAQAWQPLRLESRQSYRRLDQSNRLLPRTLFSPFRACTLQYHAGRTCSAGRRALTAAFGT